MPSFAVSIAASEPAAGGAGCLAARATAVRVDAQQSLVGAGAGRLDCRRGLRNRAAAGLGGCAGVAGTGRGTAAGGAGARGARPWLAACCGRWRRCRSSWWPGRRRDRSRARRQRRCSPRSRASPLAGCWSASCRPPGCAGGSTAMAAIDAALIAAEILQGPSGVLVAADPGGLPRFQVLEFGAARMGFGDAFLAATVGCLLATRAVTNVDGPKTQLGCRFRPIGSATARCWSPCSASRSICSSSCSTRCRRPCRLRSPWPPSNGAPAGPAGEATSAGVSEQGDAVDRGKAGDRQADAQP